MRVTERSRIGMMTLAQTRASSRLDQASRAASSGTNVSKPSDNPTAYGSMIRKNYALAMLEQHQTIATRAKGELDVAQNALSQGIDLMATAKEIALGGANTTTDAHARKLIGDQIMSMRDEMFSLANTRYGNKFLFGGTRTDAAPFDTTNGAFVGNADIVRVPVLDGVNAATNISGAQAFTSAGGRDIFADLKNLADALYANNDTAIQAAIAPMDDGHQQIVRAQVDAGFGAERFTQASDLIDSTRTSIAEQLQKEIQGDDASQFTELTLAKTAYERSIAVTKQLLDISVNTTSM